MLYKVISGGQTGADFAGLVAAKIFCLQTGGMMPKGFKTIIGPKPEWARIFGLTESNSSSYPPRTEENVKNSDATIRLAFDFNSAGEKCTLGFIKKYKRDYKDIDLNNQPDPKDIADFLKGYNVETLNIAGNSSKTNPHTFSFALDYLMRLFYEYFNQKS